VCFTSIRRAGRAAAGAQAGTACPRVGLLGVSPSLIAFSGHADFCPCVCRARAFPLIYIPGTLCALKNGKKVAVAVGAAADSDFPKGNCVYIMAPRASLLPVRINLRLDCNALWSHAINSCALAVTASNSFCVLTRWIKKNHK
jgi:hypothetical protein